MGADPKSPCLRRSSISSTHSYNHQILNQLVQSDVIDEMVKVNMSTVLIIYTGGTIGMKNTSMGYEPVPGYLQEIVSSMNMFNDKESSINNLTNDLNVVAPNADDFDININGTNVKRIKTKALITPPSLYGKRTRYSILEYDPIIDSSNMEMKDWIKIATDIEINYTLYDAFIILHGTDTMCYTASALSFLFENLGKTVIITGSQIPLAEVRNDGFGNLLGAMTIAGHFIVTEVGVYFDHCLFRGNRTTKVSAMSFHAFESPSLPPLITVGIDINVSWQHILQPHYISKFKVHKILEPNVGVIQLFPGISLSSVTAVLTTVKGVVLETFGAGNAPNNRPDLLQALKSATDRGVIIVNISQCKKGFAGDAYSTGRTLLAHGVIPGSDMNLEAALTKLAYLLGKGYSSEKIRKLIREPLRGELTVVNKNQRFAHPKTTRGLLNSLVQLLGRGTDGPKSPDNIRASNGGLVEDEELQGVDKTIVPIMLCYSARIGDVEGLKGILKEFPSMINIGDYDGRTALHVAASESQYKTVEYLLLSGANVHNRDRYNHSALFDAVMGKSPDIVELLRKDGAHFSKEVEQEVKAWFFGAVAARDFEMVKLLVSAGIDLEWVDWSGKTVLHIAVENGWVEGLEYLIEVLGNSTEKMFNVKDKSGLSPKELAGRSGGFAELLNKLQF